MSPSTIGTLSLCPLALALAACAGPQGTLMGSVFEGRTHRPVPDAIVRFSRVDGPGGPISSGLNYGGNFVLDLPPGRYTVSAQHPAMQVCASQPQPIIVQVGAINRPQICLAATDVVTPPRPVDTPPPVATPQTIAVPEKITTPGLVIAPQANSVREPAPPISLPPARASSMAANPGPAAAPDPSIADAGQAAVTPTVAPLPASRPISDIPAQYPPAPAPAFPPAPALRIVPRQR